MQTTLQRFKPATRILTSIGKDLIKDDIAAIIELVKNAYDADAENVWVSFEILDGKLITIIKDDGTGMTEDDIINKWLVPATDNKLNINYTEKFKRPILGQKGLGRYSALILGNQMKISSISNNNFVNFEINWDDIKKYKFLEDVEINLSSGLIEEKNGTEITIFNSEDAYLFNPDKFKELRRQLQLLISPLDIEENNFNIFIKNKYELTLWDSDYEKIEPFGILDLFHYRLFGTIDVSNNFFDLTFENNTLNEKVSFKPELTKELSSLIKNTKFMELYKFDFRVYDRDSQGMTSLIEKSQYTKANEMKLLLNQISGVKIYRNNFRIGTYGDNSHDWLDLNMDRVQNPSVKVSANQILGTIQINSQNGSNLVEKSARDGLQENESFKNFKHLTKLLISIMEKERFIIRRNLFYINKPKTVHEELKSISDFETVTNKVTKLLENVGLNSEQIKIALEPLNEKQKTDFFSLNKIEKQITIYEKQITLGKLVEVLMHEGKKSINGLKDFPVYAIKELKALTNIVDRNDTVDATLDKLTVHLNRIRSCALILNKLFNKINPLSSVRGKNRESFDISIAFNDAISLYQSQLESQNIIVDNKMDELIWFGWKEDFIVTFTNLIDNSIYWLKDSATKNITIEAFFENNKIRIEYRNSGQEIPLDLIKDEVIFEPGISYKEKGTGSGIGLAISGEALKRNDFTLKCKYIRNGALFILESNKQEVFN